MALILALVGSGVFVPSMQAQAAAALPNMYVYLLSGGSSYTSTVYTGTQLTLQAKVQNDGNVPLQIVANLAIPSGWNLNDKFDNCGTLAVGYSCTLTWLLTPQVSGQVYLRAYVRGSYTDFNGNANRITGVAGVSFQCIVHLFVSNPGQRLHRYKYQYRSSVPTCFQA